MSNYCQKQVVNNNHRASKNRLTFEVLNTAKCKRNRNIEERKTIEMKKESNTYLKKERRSPPYEPPLTDEEKQFSSRAHFLIIGIICSFEKDFVT